MHSAACLRYPVREKPPERQFDHMLGVKAGIDRTGVPEASHAQGSADKQHCACGDFTCHKKAAQSGLAETGWPSFVLEIRSQLDFGLRRAGVSPNATPQISDTIIVKTSTRQSMGSLSVIGRLAGFNASRSGAVQ